MVRGIRAGLAALTLAAVLAAPVAPACAQTSTGKSGRSEPAAAKPANIDRNGVLILIRGALTALDQANRTGNYTVLRDLGAPGFQANSAARLGEIFASHRQQNIDLAAIAVLEPQLTLLPQIEANGMLHMAGFFPSVPKQVDFELLFAPHERRWKLFGISVNFSDGGPVAPDTAPIPEPAPEQQEPVPPSIEIAPGSAATQPQD